MDTGKIDLNLLKLFDALLKEGSVTGASARLGLSQPAASRSLARLRKLLNDRVLVRTANGWELTPKAIALSGPVTKLLDDARAIVLPTDFDPSTAKERLTLASADHLALILMPQLVAELSEVAPGIDLVMPPVAGDNIDLIAQGGADLAIGAFQDLPARFYERRLYEEHFVCIVRSGHPVIKEGLTLENFASWPHISVVISGHGNNMVDQALAQYGLSRRIAVRTPHFLVAPSIVAESNLIMCIPQRLAYQIANKAAVEILDLPIDIPSFSPSIIWHERMHYDPAHSWLRNLIIDIAQRS